MSQVSRHFLSREPALHVSNTEVSHFFTGNSDKIGPWSFGTMEKKAYTGRIHTRLDNTGAWGGWSGNKTFCGKSHLFPTRKLC